MPKKNTTRHKQTCRHRKARRLRIWMGRAREAVRGHGVFRLIPRPAQSSRGRLVDPTLIGRLAELHLSVLTTTQPIVGAWKLSSSSLSSCVSKSVELRTWSNAEKPIDIARARAGRDSGSGFANSWALIKTRFWRANQTKPEAEKHWTHPMRT